MDAQIAEPGHFLEHSKAFDFGHAHPTHAGVDFEIDRNRPDSIERLRFFDPSDGGNEFALDDGRSSAWQSSAEDDDRNRKTRCAKRAGYHQVCNSIELALTSACVGNA